jgi:hypothetical protein
LENSIGKKKLENLVENALDIQKGLVNGIRKGRWKTLKTARGGHR